MRNQIKKCRDRKVGIIREGNVKAIREKIIQICDQLIIITQKDDVFFDMIVSDFEIMLKSLQRFYIHRCSIVINMKKE